MTNDGGLDKSSSNQCEGRLRHLRSALGLTCMEIGEGLPMGRERRVEDGPQVSGIVEREVAFTEPWKTG